MQLLGIDVVYIALALLAGAAVVAVCALALTVGAVILGALLVRVFHSTRRVFIPKATLFLLGFLETPIKHALWLFRVDEGVLDQMLVHIRNSLYNESYRNTPLGRRAIFLPQCLRSPNCPAKLTPEGIKCVECGQCGISQVKKIAQSMGYLFFIVPGSSFIKRMVKKYRPEAILGVGCPMEVKEGTAMMASAGLPVQGVMLLRDGCVNTRVNVKELLEKIWMGAHQGDWKEKFKRQVEEVSAGWADDKEGEPKVFLKVKE